ncbi:MAG: alkaline phosphatase family protein [Actinobacteria bacterium]|nr:alkaline phosphatase family protein [Actinomycetota bacterium]
MSTRLKLGAGLALVIAAAAAWMLLGAVSATAERPHHGGSHVSHVLLISVDGLHQSDLAWYVRNHPDSELARLTDGGAEYSHALTPVPSDSFPGMVGQVTGGNPGTTGVYYDAEYNHDLLPPGSACPSTQTGTAVDYFEIIDKDPSALDAGQGLPGLPDSILNMTGNPLQAGLFDTTKLPVDPRTCQAVYPHQYLRVNTVFEVAKADGLHTAWSDKHVAYEILDGPSGTGIDDLFAPEINSNSLQHNGSPYPDHGDWTTDNAATMQYDDYKVQAVINEINGYDHSGKTYEGTPAIFGMNFQTVSTAQKLPTSDGLTGGYLPGTDTPGPLVTRALGYINSRLESMVDAIGARGLADSTAIILSAKHGQSPIDPSTLTRIDDGPIVDNINKAWRDAGHSSDIVATDVIAGGPAGSRDDAFPLWLTDRSRPAADFVADYLWNHAATGNTYNPADVTMPGPSRTLDHSGLGAVYAGAAAARYFGTSPSDPRHPDVWGVVQHGVVYTGKTKKIAEHGGADFEDRNVPILVYAPGAVRPGASDEWVETTQIAPTILSLLGLNPFALQAVRIEGTPVLPGARQEHGDR